MAPGSASRFVAPMPNKTGNQLGCRNLPRRDFLNALIGLGVGTALPCSSLLAAGHIKPKSESRMRFRVWVFSDAHVGRDKKYGPRDSLAEALSQSESAAGFDWDIALDLGDMSGDVGLPKDPEGEEIVRQL